MLHFNTFRRAVLQLLQVFYFLAFRREHSEPSPLFISPSTLTSLVPNQMSLMWSQMALAADMALDSFLALMTAAPRSCTVCRRKTKRRRFEERTETSNRKEDKQEDLGKEEKLLCRLIKGKNELKNLRFR